MDMLNCLGGINYAVRKAVELRWEGQRVGAADERERKEIGGYEGGETRVK